MRICPKPIPWHDVFQRLTIYARTRPCIPPSPPVPPILAGWTFSNDVEKMRRWEGTVAWARRNACPEIVALLGEDFYYVDKPTSYVVGPGGGPMYRPWDFEKKERPPSNQILQYLETLKSHWRDIAGPELAQATRPLAFTGKKARRLLIRADPTTRPPWGGWSHLFPLESERRVFTSFRASINRAIAPHEVDHLEFTTEGHAEQSAHECQG
jgi:hypothetical protein